MNQNLPNNSRASNGIGWLAACLSALCIGILLAWTGVAVVLGTSPSAPFDPLPRTVTW